MDNERTDFTKIEIDGQEYLLFESDTDVTCIWDNGRYILSISGNLDKYEGFPNYYRKELFEIDVNGEKKECMAYLMNSGHISPPMSYYYNVIKQGYEANGMDTSYLRAALEKSVCEQCFDEIQDEELDEYDDLQMKL